MTTTNKLLHSKLFHDFAQTFFSVMRGVFVEFVIFHIVLILEGCAVFVPELQNKCIQIGKQRSALQTHAGVAGTRC